MGGENRASGTESTMHLEPNDGDSSTFEMTSLGGGGGGGGRSSVGGDGGDGGGDQGSVGSGGNRDRDGADGAKAHHNEAALGGIGSEPVGKVDYVLVYESSDTGMSAKRRERYEHELVSHHELVLTRRDGTDGKCFVLVTAPFERLCIEAEHERLKMPLRSMTQEETASVAEADGCCTCASLKPQVDEEDDYYAGAFKASMLSSFRGHDQPDTFFTDAQRSMLVYSVLSKTRFGPKMHDVGISELLQDGESYLAAYPLHSGDFDAEGEQGERANPRRLLYRRWVDVAFRFQPIDHIRGYFGEKVAMYFLWLGFYTTWLFVPSVVGVLVVLYGAASYTSSEVAAQVCNATTVYLCPPYPDIDSNRVQLSSTCNYVKLGEVFDNNMVLPFAVFMSFWATLFLEFWKRRTATVAYDWDVSNLEEDEMPRPLYYGTETRTNPVTGAREEYYPRSRRYTKYLVSFSVLLTLLSLVLIAVVAVAFYRVVIQRLVYDALTSDDGLLREYSNQAPLIASTTGACLNLIFILIFNKVYSVLAVILTNWENHRTETTYEDRLITKLSLFQFVNSYAALVYVAFFKGRFSGTPDDPNEFWGYRAEVCPVYGCMTELTITLAFILVGRQLFGNVVEVFIPWAKAKAKQRAAAKLGVETGVDASSRWERDFLLSPFPGVFDEYLEMVIQFGFISLFVAAFPLGPLCALCNNLFEIRVDAKRFVCYFRRATAKRVEDIGSWFAILEQIGTISVLANALVIGFASDVLPRLKYYLENDNNLDGWVDYAYTKSRDATADCYFRGWYTDNPAYWEDVFVRFAFVVVFENVVFGCTRAIALVIPDVPRPIRHAMSKERHESQRALEPNNYYDAGTVADEGAEVVVGA